MEIQHFQVDIQRCNTAQEILSLLRGYTGQFTKEHIQFVITRVSKSIAKTPQINEFNEVIIPKCRNLEVLDNFLLCRQLMQEKVHIDILQIKDLITNMCLQLLQLEDWPYHALVQGVRANLDGSEILPMIFNFISIALNYIQSCPYSLIHDVFYSSLINAYLRNYESIQTMNMHVETLNKIGQYNLIPHLLKSAQLTENAVKDFNHCQYRSNYLTQIIIHGQYLSIIGSELQLKDQELLQIENQIIKHKHGTMQLAANLLKVWEIRKLDLFKRTLRFWSQEALVTVGSTNQQLFVTYILWKMLSGMDKQDLDDEEIVHCISNGIQCRIEKVQSNNDIYQMGLIIWKAYIDKQELQIDNDEAETLDLQIDNEALFASLNQQKQTQLQLPNHFDDKAEENKTQMSQEKQKNEFYAENDSDNESDFEVQYQQSDDRYEDLQPIQKPLFLTDLIMSLQSENTTRYNQAIEYAESLIRNQQLNDLELMTEEVLQQLFRIQNKFALPDFSLMKYRSIQAIVEKQPKQTVVAIVNRIIDTESSVGEKLLLVEVLGNAAVALSNEKDIIQPRQYDVDLKQENEFFQTESLFDTPMVILGTLKRKLQPVKISKGQINHFHQYADNFIYPLLHLFQHQNFLNNHMLVAKAVFALSLMLEAAQNHLKIEDYSQEVYKMWRSLRWSYDNHNEVTINFAFLLSKLKKLHKSQIEETAEWLDSEVEKNGGNQTFIEVAMIVSKMINSQLK